MRRRVRVVVCVLSLLLTACGVGATTMQFRQATIDAPTAAPSNPVSAKLRIATTTSTADSGLLDALLPDFEQRHGVEVEYVAVGTGQALKLGENGDTDVVLVHARKQEDEFVARGFGINRQDVMYNDYVVVGPTDDPAKIQGIETAQEAFTQIAAAGATFASRGDTSGTHSKEQAIWASAGLTPTAELSWYKSLGQGMGETLIFANEQRAYTLTDRGTYLAMRDKLPSLGILAGGATLAQNGDPSLRNPYSVIQVNPAQHPSVNADLAAKFIAWIISPETQQRIGEFGRDKFNQALFYPLATE